MYKSCILSLLASIVITFSNAFASSYVLQEVPPLTDSGITWMYAINENGEAVGYSTTADGGRHAIYWHPSTGTLDLSDLTGGDDYSLAQDINDHGTIVGWGHDVNGIQPVIWFNKTISRLPDAPANQTGVAMAINNAEQVTGQANSTAFVWSSTVGFQSLGIPTDALSSIGHDINERGHITGSIGWPVGATTLIYTPETGITDIGDIPFGQLVSQGYGINENDFMCGRGHSANGDRAMLWRPAKGITTLGIPADKNSIAYAISDSGTVAGYTTSVLGHRAALWNSPDDFPVDLNDVIPAGSGWQIIEAYDINNYGQITGFGVDPNNMLRGYVLSPVPEVTAFWPAAANLGSFIFVFGSGFFPDTQVSFNGLPAIGVQWMTSEVVIAIAPQGDVNGPVSVTTSYGSTTSLDSFGSINTTLGITALWPSQVRGGDVAFVFGSGFNPDATASIGTTFVPASMVLSDTLMLILVPFDASSNLVTVNQNVQSTTSIQSLIIF